MPSPSRSRIRPPWPRGCAGRPRSTSPARRQRCCGRRGTRPDRRTDESRPARRPHRAGAPGHQFEGLERDGRYRHGGDEAPPGASDVRVVDYHSSGEHTQRQQRVDFGLSHAHERRGQVLGGAGGVLAKLVPHALVSRHQAQRRPDHHCRLPPVDRGGSGRLQHSVRGSRGLSGHRRAHAEQQETRQSADRPRPREADGLHHVRHRS
jgi:hypothetical protein